MRVRGFDRAAKVQQRGLDRLVTALLDRACQVWIGGH